VSPRARGALKLLALLLLLSGGVLGLRAAGLGGLLTAGGVGRLVELLRQSWTKLCPNRASGPALLR